MFGSSLKDAGVISGSALRDYWIQLEGCKCVFWCLNDVDLIFRRGQAVVGVQEVRRRRLAHTAQA